MRSIYIALIMLLLGSYNAHCTELSEDNNDLIKKTISLLSSSDSERSSHSIKKIAGLIKEYSKNDDFEKLAVITEEIISNYDHMMDAYYNADRSLIQNMFRNDIITIISISDELKKRTIDDIIIEAEQQIESYTYIRSKDGYPRGIRAWSLIEGLIADKKNISLFSDYENNLRELHMTGHHFITFPVSKILAFLNTHETKAILTDGLNSKNPQIRSDSANALSKLDNNAQEKIIKGLYSNSVDKIDAAISFVSSLNENGISYAERLNEIAWDNSFDKFLRGRAINAMGQVGLPEEKVVGYMVRIINDATDPFLQREALFALEYRLNNENNKVNAGDGYFVPAAVGRISDYKRDWIIVAIPSIEKSLEHKDKSVRKAAIMTLGNAGKNAYGIWHKLMEVYLKDPEFSELISKSVNQIHDSILAMAVDFELDEQIRMEAISKLGDFSSKLWKILSSNQKYYPFLYEMPNTTESLLDITRFNDENMKIAALDSILKILKTNNKLSRDAGREPKNEATSTRLFTIKPISEMLFSESKKVRTKSIEVLGYFGSGAQDILPELEKLKQQFPEHKDEVEKVVLKIKNNDI